MTDEEKKDTAECEALRVMFLTTIVASKAAPHNSMAALVVALATVIAATAQGNKEQIAAATAIDGPFVVSLRKAIDDETTRMAERRQAQTAVAAEPKQEPRWGVL